MLVFTGSPANHLFLFCTIKKDKVTFAALEQENTLKFKCLIINFFLYICKNIKLMLHHGKFTSGHLGSTSFETQLVFAK